MRPTLLRTSLFATLLLAAVSFMAGCATCGCPACDKSPFPPKKAGATLQNVRVDYETAALQAEETEDALAEIPLSPVPDLQQAFANFCLSTKQMEQLGQLLLAHADGMHFIGPSYLVEPAPPAAACPYPPRTPVQLTRTVELGDSFDAIAEQSWEVKRAYRAFQQDIAQIHNALCPKEVTLALVDGLDIFIRKAQVDAGSLIQSLQIAMTTIDEAKALHPEAAQPQPVQPQVPQPQAPQPQVPQPPVPQPPVPQPPVPQPPVPQPPVPQPPVPQPPVPQPPVPQPPVPQPPVPQPPVPQPQAPQPQVPQPQAPQPQAPQP